MKYCIPFSEIRNDDVSKVGGKNASLGEMIHSLKEAGVQVPDGFALTAQAWRAFLESNSITKALEETLKQLDTLSLDNLAEIGRTCRQLIRTGNLPAEIREEIRNAFGQTFGSEWIPVAVRSSATAEDLPDASFAGQHESYLNVHGEEALFQAVQKCYVSLYNDRAIKYRIDNGFDHMQVALSVGIQRMVRSDRGSAGVAFTLDPETGFKNLVYLTSSWGLGENVVQGAVNPDEFYVWKQGLTQGHQSIISRKCGSKENKMIYSDDPDQPIVRIETGPQERNVYSLNDREVTQLADWCLKIENLYDLPMDIEWAKDGISGALYILQARPETIHKGATQISIKEFRLKADDTVPLCKGKAVGRAVASGRVCIVNSLADAPRVQNGDIIVADITNPDWNALLRKAVSIVTNKGGRTSHASIVARELGIHAVVGTGDATDKLRDGQIVTVSCAEGDEGLVYDGKLDWETTEIRLTDIPQTHTKPMFILADPEKAFLLAQYPSEGVGLLRMEFIISNSIRIHPMALVRFEDLPDSNDRRAIAAITTAYPDKARYFIEKLSESVAMVAAAFYPREVIVRMSDFKTNEYASLLGGSLFEPEEENPMLGFRGASRYYHPRYRDGFGLECEAMRQVRDEMGLTNVKLMIPFCRTLEEGRKVLETMSSFGLTRGQNGLEVYVMAEIPSNVILARQFAEIFDGFSIGSNDLTQLTLGIDRDSAIISELFDENNQAVRDMLSQVIRSAHAGGRPIGLCGQAPSDYPAFAGFLVERGIDSVSFTPDALLRGIQNIHMAEEKLKQMPPAART